MSASFGRSLLPRTATRPLSPSPANGRDVSPYVSALQDSAATLSAGAIGSSSPSGCEQQAHNPHASDHRDGRMNAEIRATCKNKVPRMQHTAQLWETRIWGWNEIGVPGSFNGHDVQKGRAFANDVCKKNLVRVTGLGDITDTDSHVYYSGTESNPIDNPCNLP